ncbi:MAG TPA: ThuA domain-containing protein [Tepidisphaeraceae bacterium]|nr:ThuA domain-containing protein [Tepidisphaeraceae bacterium]
MRRNQMTSRLAAAACAMGLLLSGSARAADRTAKPDQVKKMEAALPDKAPAQPAKPRKVLVYGNAEGFVHSSIELGEETIVKLGEKTGAWTATVSNDPASFDDLSSYDGVVLVSTTGHFLLPRKGNEKAKDPSYKQKEHQRMQNLFDFVKKDSKGLAGIHAATDAYYDNRQYGELIGGYFNQHPWNEKVGIKLDHPNSPLTKMFKKNGIDIADEIYQFSPKGKNKEGKEEQTYSRKHDHVLLSLDYTTDGRTAKKGKSPDNDYGVAWTRTAGTGRVFYCSLGHREEIYWNPVILKFYLAGIQYALGDLPDPTAGGRTAAAK